MTQILVDFESKDTSPLDVIKTLDDRMKQNLEEGKITDYSISLHIEDHEITRSHDEVLVAREPEPEEETPP